MVEYGTATCLEDLRDEYGDLPCDFCDRGYDVAEDTNLLGPVVKVIDPCEKCRVGQFIKSLS
jgi:hypothetical protein